MQPPNPSAPSLADPTNPYQNAFGPGQTATPIEDVKSPTGETVEKGQRGKSGTYIFSGIITREEYNPDLQRWEALKNYDIMRRSDATVQALLEVIKLPILSATWTVQAASDDPQDIEIADWVRHCLFEYKIVFPDLLSEILTYQDFGYSVFEKIWDYYDWNGKQMIGLVDLQSRKQRSIYRWQTNDPQPTFGITQYVPGGTYSVPGDKLVVFTRKKEGENWEGISVLRASYKHWKIKDSLELIEAIRHERQGLGIIEIIPPEGANEDDIDDAIENARQARASEEAVIKHPKDWVIQFMQMQAGPTQASDIQSTLEYHKREMLKSVLAQFIELGGNKGGSGSRATSQDHSALFELAEEFTAKYIGNVFNKQIIKELVDLNYSNVEAYPTLEHSKIGDEDVAGISTAVNQLMSAGALTPDPELEQWARTLLHAPDLSEDMIENYDELPSRQKQPVVMPVPATPETPDNAQTDEQSKTANEALDKLKSYNRKLIDIVVR